MSAEQPTIIYTLTDEAPLLATYAFLPIVRTFADAAGIDVKTSDISVAARILAEFDDYLTEEQRVPDNLAELGELTQQPDTNIIKLPNISASVPQLLAAIKELKAKGYDLPDYPGEPKTDEEKEIKDRYAKVLGSAVNPVLREGNSDRRAPKAVKEYARKHPHSMSEWSQASRTHVATMKDGDFYHGEKSLTLDKARKVKMVLETQERRDDRAQAGGHARRRRRDRQHVHEQEGPLRLLRGADGGRLQDRRDVLAARQGHHDEGVAPHRVRPRGQDLLQGRLRQAPEAVRRTRASMSTTACPICTTRSSRCPPRSARRSSSDLHACHEHRPELAMVDSAKGITNFHSPSDVIVDASMPAMIRLGGKMYGADGRTKDTKAVNPESTFSRIYQEIINFCKTNGQFDPTTMGTVPNVGLMAQQAEEYGSHDKTFEIPEDGVANIVDIDTGEVLLTQNVEDGRHLAHARRQGRRRSATGSSWPSPGRATPACRWCSGWTERPHEDELRKKVKTYLKDHDTEGLTSRSCRRCGPCGTRSSA